MGKRLQRILAAQKTVARALDELGEDDGAPETWPDEGLDFFGSDDYDVDDDYAAMAHNISQAYGDCAARRPSQIKVLRDDWTTVGHAPPNCTFPFGYRGRVYYGCTDEGYGGIFWCANDCDFSLGKIMHRGVCDIPRNTRGVLGTGVALSALNVFVALLFSVGFVVILGVFLVEWRRRRSGKFSGTVDYDEETPIGGQRQFELTEQTRQ
jgi:hypothetical protein